MTDDELMHYGVIGMKCGVHRGNVAQAYNKSAVKRKKLDNRVAEAKKAYDRATIKANTGVSHKYKKLQAKADRQQYKANKYKARYEKNLQKKVLLKPGISKLSVKQRNGLKQWIRHLKIMMYLNFHHLR